MPPGVSFGRVFAHGITNVHWLGSGRVYRRRLDLGFLQPQEAPTMNTILLGFIIAAVFFTGGFYTGRNWPKK